MTSSMASKNDCKYKPIPFVLSPNLFQLCLSYQEAARLWKHPLTRLSPLRYWGDRLLISLPSFVRERWQTAHAPIFVKLRDKKTCRMSHAVRLRLFQIWNVLVWIWDIKALIKVTFILLEFHHPYETVQKRMIPISPNSLRFQLVPCDLVQHTV